MNRRGLLALIGGGAASAASGMSVKDAAKAIGATDALVMSAPPIGGDPVPVGSGSFSSHHRVMQRLWRARDRATHGHHTMPAHIATKRSWSPVFKEAVLRREADILEAFIEQVERDEELASRVARFLGVDA